MGVDRGESDVARLGLPHGLRRLRGLGRPPRRDPDPDRSYDLNGGVVLWT